MQELINYIKNHTERTKSIDANTVKEGKSAVVYTLDSVTTEKITNKPVSDVHFFKVATINSPSKNEFTDLIIKHYPNLKRLESGPSYIEIGAELGSQEIALLFLALGELLGIWSVIIPAKLGLPPEMAGQGFIMCSGYIQ